MKEVYDIDNGEIKYAYPSRRDSNIYEYPSRTTIIPPPPHNLETERVVFRESQWRIYLKTDDQHYRIFSDKSLNPMDLLRQERNARLKKIDQVIESYENQGLAIPNHWIDYRADLRNVPQHVEFGLVEPPKIVSGKLEFNSWPDPPKS